MIQRKTVLDFTHQSIMTSLITTFTRCATTTMKAFQRTTICPTIKWTCLMKKCTTYFDNEVEPAEERFLYPQEPSRMPPVFAKEHTGYNTYQDPCRAESAIHTQYLENFQYQNSPNPQSIGVSAGFPSRIISSWIAKSSLLFYLAKSPTSRVMVSPASTTRA